MYRIEYLLGLFFSFTTGRKVVNDFGSLWIVWAGLHSQKIN